MKIAKWENWSNCILGFLIVGIPFVFVPLNADTRNGANFHPTLASAANWNLWLVGSIIAISALLALQDLKPWEEWVNLVLGVWLIFSPWIFDYSFASGLSRNLIIAGSAIALISGIALPKARKPSELSP